MPLSFEGQFVIAVTTTITNMQVVTGNKILKIGGIDLAVKSNDKESHFCLEYYSTHGIKPLLRNTPHFY